MKKKIVFILAMLAVRGILWVIFRNARDTDQPKVFYRKRLFNNYNGYIVPPFGIFIKESERDNTALMEHELMHWKQFQREGFAAFLFHYGKEAYQKGYDKNPYEIEARTVETGYCKENYTDCVRSGKAVTVHNPQFRK